MRLWPVWFVGLASQGHQWRHEAAVDGYPVLKLSPHPEPHLAVFGWPEIWP